MNEYLTINLYSMNRQIGKLDYISVSTNFHLLYILTFWFKQLKPKSKVKALVYNHTNI